MSADRIKAIRGRLAAATPGPWPVGEEYGEERWQAVGPAFLGGTREGKAADAALVSNAPDDLAFLLAEVERLGGGGVHVDYKGEPDLRPLAERAVASDAIPSDKDDAIAIVVERLRLMHRKILNTPVSREDRASLPEKEGPEAPAEWPLWRTMVAWSPVLWDYAMLVESRLVSLEKMRVERDAALDRAREASFKPSAAERAFNRRQAILGPRLTTALSEALAVLAEHAPDPSKPPSGVPVADPDDVCKNCKHPRREHRLKRTQTHRANHPVGCKCLLCADFVTVLPGAPTECSSGFTVCACTRFVGPGTAKPSYGVDATYRPDAAADWLEGVAAEIEACANSGVVLTSAEDGYPEIQSRLLALAARVRS